LRPGLGLILEGCGLALSLRVEALALALSLRVVAWPYP